MRELSYALAELVEVDRAAKLLAAEHKPRIVLRPRAVNETDFTVRVEGGTEQIFRVIGAKPERWVQQTDFTNDEAVGFLADRLAKLGVEDELFKAGAVPGSAVMIGAGDGVVFDWEPTLTSAAELITAPRGTDARLDESRRPTRDQRRAEYFERMDAKAAARAADAAERAGGFWDDDSGTGDAASDDEVQP